MPVIGLGGSKPPSDTIPSVPEDDALRFEPVPPDASQFQGPVGHSTTCLDLLAPDCWATLVRICALAFGSVLSGVEAIDSFSLTFGRRQGFQEVCCASTVF